MQRELKLSISVLHIDFEKKKKFL